MSSLEPLHESLLWLGRLVNAREVSASIGREALDLAKRNWDLASLDLCKHVTAFARAELEHVSRERREEIPVLKKQRSGACRDAVKEAVSSGSNPSSTSAGGVEKSGGNPAGGAHGNTASKSD